MLSMGFGPFLCNITVMTAIKKTSQIIFYFQALKAEI
jgi:hypothetical protein